MGVVTLKRPDVLGLAAAALAVAMAVVYVSLMRAQGDSPRSWYLALLLAGALLAGVGSVLKAPWGRVALVGAAAILLPAGFIASIGPPIMLAGALALLATLRSLEATGS